MIYYYTEEGKTALEISKLLPYSKDKILNTLREQGIKIRPSTRRAVGQPGEKYGLITLLYPTEKRQQGSIMWICHCEGCGKDKEINISNLVNLKTQTCGCKRMSHGEIKIADLLQKAAISNEQEVSPIESSPRLRYDFYLPEYNTYIEFDGVQHFQPKDIFGGEEEFEICHKNDLIKNKYCFDNNITLIRIPYSHLNDLDVEDLLPATSRFILTPENELEYYDKGGN